MIREIEYMIQEGWVEVQKHQQRDLYIYNYTQKTQFEKYWNEITLQCRGLILDSEGEIIARPFKKFFNIEEHSSEHIPQESFELYEKMDGSLGILYWVNDFPYIATRGSFHSDQAVKANQMLNTTYSHVLKNLNKEYTYLFEIIYPENRIVVNYGDFEGLVLLGIIHPKTGIEMPLDVSLGFPVVKSYDALGGFEQIKKLNWDNKEGFVVRFNNGFRVKIKFEEYCRLHRILTNVSNKTNWETLKNGEDFNDILQKVPDEFYNWVRKTKEELENKFKEIETRNLSLIRNDFISRREAADYYNQFEDKKLLFLMYDNKNYQDYIWKKIRPTFFKPFKDGIEN